MKIEPFMWTIFCDDVRQEVGNKFSYLGIYGPNLVVAAFPTTLVKLCCVLSLRVPAKSPPNSVIFKLLRDEEILFEADLSEAAQSHAAAIPDADSNDLATTISTVAQLIGLPVTQRCFLKTRAMVDGKELRGGTLEFMAADMSH